jgi:hypothetical protein
MSKIARAILAGYPKKTGSIPIIAVSFDGKEWWS